jgi:hypothetical protein
MSDKSPNRDALLAEIAVREWEIALYETGKTTILENGEPVTIETVQQWREQIAELRRLSQAP